MPTTWWTRCGPAPPWPPPLLGRTRADGQADARLIAQEAGGQDRRGQGDRGDQGTAFGVEGEFLAFFLVGQLIGDRGGVLAGAGNRGVPGGVGGQGSVVLV